MRMLAVGNLTAEDLKSILDYDEESGAFTWKVRRGIDGSTRHWNRTWAGKKAGSIDVKGYWRITVYGRFYKAHRLAWVIAHGEWPPDEIDHIDGNRSNNAISNLRSATSVQNQWNKVAVNTTSGFRGVSKHHKKWRATIRVNGTTMYLGLFDTPEAASAVYESAADKLRGEFACKRA